MLFTIVAAGVPPGAVTKVMTNELISGRSGFADHEVIKKSEIFRGVMLSQAAPEYPRNGQKTTLLSPPEI
jgi:hypothetical protein